MTTVKPLVGFVGQGYVGKNYADDFEARGYPVVRYSLEEPYVANKDRIAECDIVLIAVPTPTTPEGFDASIVESALALVGEGKVAVIKSTLLPGTTSRFQQKFPNRTIFFSPEFLRELTAAEDAAHPFSTIVGLAADTPEHQAAAQVLLQVLPSASFTHTCTSTEAEFIKYAQNTDGYVNIVYFNILHDLAKALGADWQQILPALQADPDIPSRFANPVHKSGRGAGGHCLVKDFAALEALHGELLPADALGHAVMKALSDKNRALLVESKKDLDIVKGVYGEK